MSEYIIGLTGGVASGKSTVEARFRALDIVVADADAAAQLWLQVAMAWPKWWLRLAAAS